jgi:hypothetical protein
MLFIKKGFTFAVLGLSHIDPTCLNRTINNAHSLRPQAGPPQRACPCGLRCSLPTALWPMLVEAPGLSLSILSQSRETVFEPEACCRSASQMQQVPRAIRCLPADPLGCLMSQWHRHGHSSFHLPRGWHQTHSSGRLEAVSTFFLCFWLQAPRSVSMAR